MSKNDFSTFGVDPTGPELTENPYEFIDEHIVKPSKKLVAETE